MTRITAIAVTLSAALSQTAIADGHADAAAGEAVFRQCASCHSLDEGRNGAGPSLYGVVGAMAGNSDGFRYSSAITDSGLTWDEENLTAFLANPREFLPGNRMGFRGIRDEQDVANLIAYLASTAGE